MASVVIHSATCGTRCAFSRPSRDGMVSFCAAECSTSAASSVHDR